MNTTHLLVVTLFLPRHDGERQRYLLGKLTRTHKCVYGEKLREWPPHQLEGTIYVPTLGPGQACQLLIGGQDDVASVLYDDIAAEEICWYVFFLQLEVKVDRIVWAQALADAIGRSRQVHWLRQRRTRCGSQFVYQNLKKVKGKAK